MRRLLPATVLLTLLLTAAPLLATEANPTAKQRELIEKLLEVANIDKNAHSMMDAMYGQIEKQLLADKGNSEDVAEGRLMFADMREELAKLDLGGELHEAFVRIYARHFNEQELGDLIAFYNSPTGRKSIELMPQLMSEGMEAGVQHITPKIEQAMTTVMEKHEKKYPWRKTMSDMRSVATAVEAYATDNEKYPAGDYESLKAALSPTYISKFPDKDMWGHGYAYVVSDDLQHYRLISAGADMNFEWDSRRIVLPKEGEEAPVKYRERMEDDLIYADGQFVQLPLQAKPKSDQ